MCRPVHKNMNIFLKKYWLILLLITTVVVLFLIKIFLAQKPIPQITQEKLPSPRFIQEQVTNQTINYQLTFSPPSDFPSSLPVYKVSGYKTETFPEIVPDLSGPPVVSSDSAVVELAGAFLKEKGVEENFLEISQIKYRRVKKMETFPATGSGEIDVFVVNFWPNIDKVTLISDTPASPLSSVWLGKNSRVQKAFTTNFVLEEMSSYLLRSLTVASQDVLNQKGTLVWLEKEEAYESVSPKTIQTIIIDRVSLAYFISSENPVFLEPIYVFEGKAVLLAEEKTIRAAVYLPAVEEKYLQP